MIYKGERNVKLVVLDTKADNSYVKIKNDNDLLEVVKNNLNTVDFDQIQDKQAEIEIIDLNVIANNNSRSSTDYHGDMFYHKIYYIYYRIFEIKKKAI